jgi:hypothetical protein
MKLAQATANEVSRMSSMHYDLDTMIMNQVRNMTLAGKQVMATKIADYCATCEKEAK